MPGPGRRASGPSTGAGRGSTMGGAAGAVAIGLSGLVCEVEPVCSVRACRCRPSTSGRPGAGARRVACSGTGEASAFGLCRLLLV